MPDITLHYIYDPLCGWCYGAGPLVKAARAVLPVAAHGGGMMAGPNRQHVSPQLRDYVMPHDRRIAELTGQPFGEAYFDGLLRDATAVFDSGPPIAAVLAANRVNGSGLDLLARLQTAHYVEGRRISDMDVLADLAVELAMSRPAFAAAHEDIIASGAAAAHISGSRTLLTRLRGRGFPTFALEKPDGSFQMIDANAFHRHPEAFQAMLRAAAP